MREGSCIKSEKAIETIGTETLLNYKSCSPCSLPAKIQYSFDYAQQVNSLSNPMQPGPIYFKTPQCVEEIGVMCKEMPRQVFSSMRPLLLERGQTQLSAMFTIIWNLVTDS